MKKIFVIEDDIDHFKLIKTILEDSNFTVFPSNDQAFDDFKTKLISPECLNIDSTEHLEKFLFNHLIKEKPHAIVCDLKLVDDDKSNGSTNTYGHMIIDLIRNRYKNSGTDFSEFIPILAFSQFSMLGVKPIQKGVDFMNKFFITSSHVVSPTDFSAKKELFIAKINYLISDHKRNQTLVKILKPTFDEYKKLLINS